MVLIFTLAAASAAVEEESMSAPFSICNCIETRPQFIVLLVLFVFLLPICQAVSHFSIQKIKEIHFNRFYSKKYYDIKIAIARMSHVWNCVKSGFMSWLSV